MKDAKEQEGQTRYQEIMANNNSAINLCNKIENTQKQRQFRSLLKWWWNRLTFRGYKNVQQKVTKGRVPYNGF